MGFVEVFREVEAAQAAGLVREYAIGGAVAATFYLEPTATQDIDVFVALADDPSRPLIDISPVLRFLVSRGGVLEGEHVRVSGWLVQIRVAPSPLVEEAIREAKTEFVAGQSVRVFSALHLAAIALETGRAKDRLRLLQFLESGVVTREAFSQFTVSHGLSDRWRAFVAQVLGGTP